MNRTDIEVVKALCSGQEVPSGRISSVLEDRLRSEHLVCAISHGSRVAYKALRPAVLAEAFASELAVASISDGHMSDDCTRAELVAAVGDSKALTIRSCPGFPVNSYERIPAVLNGRELIIDPGEGCFLFVSDWKRFTIPPEVIVVGVENMENFRKAAAMRSLFEFLCAPVLFVSRYPQSGDLVRWLQTVPNRYLHFGDLDLAGINIYLTEFYQFIGERASYFIPFDADERLSAGSRTRYDTQLPRFGNMIITDPRVQYLVDLIHKHHRGYDQEGYLCNLREWLA